MMKMMHLHKQKKYWMWCAIGLLMACHFINSDTDQTALLPQRLSAPASLLADAQVQALLARYGWSVKSRLADYRVTLPTTFAHTPGGFPIAIYWAYNHEFSQAIGLPLRPLLGQRVNVTIYALNEPLPAFLYPYTTARAIILTHEQTVVGAWIDKGGHDAFACALNRQSFTEITHQSWGEWLVSAGVVNPRGPLEKDLTSLSPEQLIERYVAATNWLDDIKYTFVTRRSLLDYLFANMRDDELFHRNFSEAYDHLLRTLEIPWPRRLTAITLIASGDNMLEYRVDEVGFIILKEEVEGMGWRIAECGTGP